jgi:hypothetical protein
MKNDISFLYTPIANTRCGLASSSIFTNLQIHILRINRQLLDLAWNSNMKLHNQTP